MSSPKPWRQFEAKTTFLRVPSDDWLSVKQGRKTEFRASGHFATQLWNVSPPTAVVGYRIKRVGAPDSTLLVLEKTWQEPLGAIDAESLEREGFPTFAHFRRYWMARTHTRFAPLKEVQVYRVRPIAEADHVEIGLELFRRLYREHLG